MSKDSPRTSVLRDNDLIQKGQDDLIRRGDAREILEDEGFLERSLERLAALPAVQPTVSPELLATTNDVAALVEAVDAAFACRMIPKSSVSEGGANKYSEQVRVADQLRATLARVKGEIK